MTQNNPTLVVLGDGGVGKTSIIVRYTESRFDEGMTPTLLDFYSTSVRLSDGRVVTMDIADTAGQDDLHSIRDKYLDTGDLFLVVYSVDNPKSLSTAKDLLDQIKVIKLNEPFDFVLVGNKCDLENRAIMYEDGKHLAEAFKGKFIETSAKTKKNIQETFNELACMCLNQTESDVGCTCRIG